MELIGIMILGKETLFRREDLINSEFMPPSVASEKKVQSIIPDRRYIW
jgi:hypothetical protein